jgi:hypothetical protein
VANIGVNPTTGEVDPRLEVWMFEFDEDIYGETIETDLIAFLRPEEKFASVEAMVKSFSQNDRDHMVEDGKISVTCEFCSANYVFAPGEVEAKAG